MTLPVTTKEFWRERILTALATGKELHTVIYDTDYQNWLNIQDATLGVLNRYLRPRFKLLDAGCGYGALYDALKQNPDLGSVEYTGIDLSPELIDIAKIRNPGVNFIESDLQNLDYKANHFDLTVMRSIKEMFSLYHKDDEWNLVERSVSRVSKAILLIEYENPNNCQLIRTHLK